MKFPNATESYNMNIKLAYLRGVMLPPSGADGRRRGQYPTDWIVRRYKGILYHTENYLLLQLDDLYLVIQILVGYVV